MQHSLDILNSDDGDNVAQAIFFRQLFVPLTAACKFFFFSRKAKMTREKLFCRYARFKM